MHELLHYATHHKDFENKFSATTLVGFNHITTPKTENNVYLPDKRVIKYTGLNEGITEILAIYLSKKYFGDSRVRSDPSVKSSERIAYPEEIMKVKRLIKNTYLLSDIRPDEGHKSATFSNLPDAVLDHILTMYLKGEHKSMALDVIQAIGKQRLKKVLQEI